MGKLERIKDHYPGNGMHKTFIQQARQKSSVWPQIWNWNLTTSVQWPWLQHTYVKKVNNTVTPTAVGNVVFYGHGSCAFSNWKKNTKQNQQNNKRKNKTETMNNCAVLNHFGNTCTQICASPKEDFCAVKYAASMWQNLFPAEAIGWTLLKKKWKENAHWHG